MRKVRTDEEKVAKQIAKLISDVSLDLDEIGKHLATANPHLSYRRLLEIAESAEYEKEATSVRITHDPLF
jgi:division protein CdvB (Snf7/Vps24/ESCRT-III family)